MPVILESLVSIGVDTRVIVDFDIIQDENILKKLFEIAGGKWKEIESDWRLVYKEIESK